MWLNVMQRQARGVARKQRTLLPRQPQLLGKDPQGLTYVQASLGTLHSFWQPVRWSMLPR